MYGSTLLDIGEHGPVNGKIVLMDKDTVTLEIDWFGHPIMSQGLRCRVSRG